MNVTFPEHSIELIGLAVSIIAIFISIRSNRIARSAKKFDLRLEASRIEDSLPRAIDTAEEKHTEAERSNKFILVARGLFNSSVRQQFMIDWEADQGRLRAMREAMPVKKKPLENMKEEELLAYISSAEPWLNDVSEIRDKYMDKIAADEVSRDRLAASKRKN